MPNVSTPVSSIAYQNSPSLWQAPAQQTAAPLTRPGSLVPLDQLMLQVRRNAQTSVPARPQSFAPAPAAAPAVTGAVGALIGPGAKGSAVEHIQLRLQHWGYQLEADSDYGAHTLRTVSQFQRDQGLDANGRVGQTTLAALERNPSQTPAIASLRAGQGQLARGAQGSAVEYVQQRLKTWGYDVGKADGDYGTRTQEGVRHFQQDRGIQVNGRVGQTTLQALEQTPVRAGRLETTSEGQKLARTAQSVAARRDTVGWCYSGVATAVSKALGIELSGHSAYQASNILARNPDFKEVRALKPKDLPKLPAGAIVVWGKTGASPHGHISVALGNGREASDHIDHQLTNLRGYTNFRVFMPVG
ncbi:MAG: peptidoglycan-binding protein [Candidatus Sericytochromatia bacterium]